MVIDPLITDTIASIQKGKQVLAATGKRRQIQLNTPLIPQIGVVFPGQILELVESTPWKGYIDSVAIAATHGNVMQTIGIEHVQEF